MKRGYWIWLITLFGLSQLHGIAQTNDYANEVKARLKIVDLFELYEKYANMDQSFSSYVESFVDLFKNADATVYNDIVGLSSKDTLTAIEYARILSGKSDVTRISVKNIKITDTDFDGDVYTFQCTFDKSTNITNDCKIEYASDFFHEKDYQLKATIEFNRKSDDCKFLRIDGTSFSKRELAEDYIVIDNHDGNYSGVLYDKQPLEYNAAQQAFLENGGSFTHRDPDVAVKASLIDAECHLWSLKLTPRHWRLKIHYDLGIGDSYSFDDIFNSSSSSSKSFGLDLGFVFPSKSKTKVGVFFGAGMTDSELKLTQDYGSNTLSYSTNQDVTGLTYQRYYQNLNIYQAYKFTDITIPVYFDFQLPMGKIVSLYFDLGAKANLNMAHEVNETRGSAYVYGIYPSLGNLRMDEHWGYNGFGNQSYNNDNLASTEVENVNSLTIDGFGGIGTRIKIPTTPLEIDLGVNYQLGLMKVIETDSRSNLSLYPSMEASSIVYNTVTGVNNTNRVRNIVELLDEVKRNQLRLHFGIILKF